VKLTARIATMLRTAGTCRVDSLGAVATPASPSRSEGSGAPSARLLALALAAVLALFALAAPLASAAAPTVTIDAASNLGIVTAKVEGAVNPQGKETNYHFEYTSQAQYEAEGNSFANAGQAGFGSVSAGEPNTPVEATLEGLLPGTTYHLRLVAENEDSAGTPSEAVAATFATDPATAPALTLDATPAVSYTSAHLSGTIDPEGGNVDPVAGTLGYYWELQYSHDPVNDGWSAAASGEINGAEAEGNSPIAISADPSLTPHTTYSFRIFIYYAGINAQSAEPDPTFETLEVATPTVTMNPVTTFTGTTAELSGEINPNAPAGNPAAFNVNWHFECSPECPELSGGEITADASSHHVPVEATRLQPNTEYHVKLIAENAGGSAEAGQIFNTMALVPTITEVAGVTDGEGGYFLRGGVNPHNSPVTVCTFEYGPTADYGLSLPCDTDPTGGNTPVLVNAHPTGLNPEVTYHFRISATNGAGPVVHGPDGTFIASLASEAGCSNEALRAESFSLNLPDCRAYEMVTPPFKAGFDLYAGGGVSLDGSTVGFLTNGAFAGIQQAGTANSYQAVRGPSGWSSSSLLPPSSVLAQPQYANPDLIDQTQDLKTTLWSLHKPGESNVTEDIYLRRPDGQFVLVGPSQTRPAKQDPSGILTTYRGGSADLSHILFQSTYDLLGTGETGLFEYAGAGTSAPELRLVGLEDGGQHLISRCRIGLGDAIGDLAHNAISRDGRTIFFTVRPESCPLGEGIDFAELYARTDDGRHTVAVGISHCTRVAPEPVCGPSSGDLYRGAANDGSAVFFTTSQQLLNEDTDSGEDLYRYDLTGSGLERISVPEAGHSAEVEGVEAIADDGSLVYFVAKGVLAANVGADGTDPTAGANNFYVWNRDASGPGRVRFIAQLPSGAEAQLWSTGQIIHQAYPTPDDNSLTFASFGQLTADDTDTSLDVYRYSVGDSALQRISIAAPGAAQGAGNGPLDATLGPAVGGSGVPSLPYADVSKASGRPVSDDGAFSFFQTTEALSPEDHNTSMDVYGFHDGHVALISDGVVTPQNPLNPNSLLFGTSPSGHDVFFMTRAGILPQDTDGGSTDIYDARIRGGFPQPPPAAGCETAKCQGPAASPPGFSPASAKFSGPGNQTTPPGPAKVKVSKPTAIRGTKAVLKVTVPEKGRIAVSGANVKKTSKKVAKKGSYRVAVSLTAKATRQLAKHPVRANVKVAFTAAGGKGSSAKVQLTFQPAAEQSKRASNRRANVLSSITQKGR
jgi:hypothetical protein